MSRSALVGNVMAMLVDAGFAVSDRCAIRPKSFDVVARRGDSLVLVKILGNIDSFDADTGIEMRRLGRYLDATPIVIGLRTRDEDLKPGVVYFRHGVPVLSPDTCFELFIEEVPPLIYAAPGGLYVTIDETVLADERRARGMSLGQLASELGVSRRTVSKYEDGMNASIEVAMQLEDIFDAPLTTPVDVLEGADDLDEDLSAIDDISIDPADEPIVAMLSRAGFTVHPTDRAPFKTVSRDEDHRDNMLTGHSAYTKTAEKRARIMGSISRVTRTRSVYFVDSASKESIEGTAIVEREETKSIEDADDLRDLIADRTKRSERYA